MRAKKATIDANYWALPEVWAAGFWGGVVYQQLLILNQSHDCRGSLPFAITRPDYLARVMLLESADGLSEPPVELVRVGIRKAQKAGLLRVTDDGIALLVWSGAKVSTAVPSHERQKRYRERQQKVEVYGPKPRRTFGKRRVTKRDVTLRNAPSRTVSGRNQMATPPLSPLPSDSEISDLRSGDLGSEISDPPDSGQTGVTKRYVTQRNATETLPEVETHPVAQQAIDAWADRQLAALTAQEPRGAVEEVAPVADSGPEVGAAPGAKQKGVKREKVPPPMEALTLGILLAECIVENHPDSKLARMSDSDRAARATAWAADPIRLLHERDGFSYGEIQSMILWSQKNSFWSTVILSGTNLRAHWEKMSAQRGRVTSKKQEPGVGRSDPAPHNTYRDGEVPV